MDDVVAFLRAAGAERFLHARDRTLLDHLVGTREILQRWGQSERVQQVGLLHSVYGTDSYQRQLLDLSRRTEVAALAGERAERLAYLFCAVPRKALFAAAGAHEPTVLPVGLGRTDEEIVAAEEIDELVVVHMANKAEQARAKDHSPGEWLARVRKLSAALSERPIEVPRALGGQLGSFSTEDEGIVRNAYRSAVAELGDRAGGAERRFAQVIGGCPALPEPYLWLAFLSLCREERGIAAWWAARATERLGELGTSWDKRLSYEQWAVVAARLQSRSADGVPTSQAGVFGPVQLLTALTAGDRTAPAVPAGGDGADNGRQTQLGEERFRNYIETFRQHGGDRLRRHYPGLDSRPFHDPADFPLVRYLEENFSAIRAEIRAFDPSRFRPEAESIERAGDWDVLFFYDRGRRIKENCTACPVLIEGISGQSSMTTIAGLIYASRLRGGTHIEPHRGPTNFRLRCHLGIEVPDGDCAIRVGGETRSWQEGRCLVLDDHFQHEAWNHTDRDRIVLVIDIWHPALTAREVELLAGLHRYAYRYARRQHRWWLRHYPESAVPITQ